MAVVEKIDDYRLQYDGDLPISTGRSRYDKSWKNTKMRWSVLVGKLKTTTRTRETLAEFMKMSKPDQDNIKDIGGFVGGSLKEGRRKISNVAVRQLITLDADFAPAGLSRDLEYIIPGAYAVYSTHKHKPEKPRLRILIPLDREVSPDEYEAISRKIAEQIGIDYFDDTTYQPSRLMFWPSTASDGEYVFDYVDAPWIKADDILALYPDWTDISYWPESSHTKESRKKTADKQEDPTTKPGLIGAFCRTYSITDAIGLFLSDVYLECAMPGRYTYAEGSTSAGLVIYDERFAYSNHATDPASGKLCNAFDLVRIHRFGDLDQDTSGDTPTTKLPSYAAMMDWVKTDKETIKTSVTERMEEAQQGFTEDDEWLSALVLNKTGQVAGTLNNLLLIMQNDPALSGIVFNQLADNLEIRDGGVPWKKQGRFWRDADDAQLEAYLAGAYTEFAKVKIMSAVTKVADDRAYHPVREYLDSLPEWDGVLRVDGLLIDYLGAEDTPYVRAVTRKTLCAAVNRVQRPGCKFDTVLVMCGPQGIGKSTLIHKLGKDWFSDSLNLTDTKDKTAAEKLQGCWIIEIGEMAGLGNAGVKTLRSFITTQDDRYRASYGRRVSSHPRQCVLIGTTNSEDGYLNDTDGGRRFWPVDTPGDGLYDPWDLTDDDVDQIWAEAMQYVRDGEPLILTGDTADEARTMQQKAMIGDPRESKVSDYLDTMLPDDWYRRNMDQRRDFLYGSETPKPETPLRRDRVTAQEIWCECFGYDIRKMEQKDVYTIKRIMTKMDGWTYSSAWLPRDKAYGGKQMRGYIRCFKS